MSTSSDWQHLYQQSSLTDRLPHQGSMTALDWSVISICGPQAKPFLQGQVTLNVDSLSPGTLAYGGYCNLKGRLHALFYLAQIDDETFWMILPKENEHHALTTLKKYAMFSKVRFSVDRASPCIGLINPSDEAYKTQAFTLKNLTVNESTITLIGLSHQRVMVLGDTQAMINTWKTLQGTSSPTQSDVWNSLDIQDGRAFLSEQTLEVFLPHYIGLVELGGVDFTKGCYLGQEIIARMQYRGNIKRKRMLAKTQAHTLPPAGTAVQTDQHKEVGHVINAAQHKGGIELLLTLQEEAQPLKLQLNLPQMPSLTEVQAYP